MSELEFVAAPVGGWCEPETGVCHVEIAEEEAIDETDGPPTR